MLIFDPLPPVHKRPNQTPLPGRQHLIFKISIQKYKIM